ncbi:VOC family protein [Dermatobacter hominis]|uniref:VOC family protein n=1 Tax=Dermatobacter hominis TaxID=2884263 RepID=UPI001D129340|nr:VOC family protein [Dermatobacter hominis]UDY34794.1 VOC family protein [Dermatobacter hominis]
MTSFLPYLNFDGTCRDAFTRYQQVFGGELFVMGAEDAPGDGDVPEGFEGRVIHAALMLDGALLMGSDTQPGGGKAPQSTYVSYQAPDVEAARRAFDDLAADGEVDMSFAETFFSPGFGTLTDRFGTLWMINVETDGPPTGAG